MQGHIHQYKIGLLCCRSKFAKIAVEIENIWIWKRRVLMAARRKNIREKFYAKEISFLANALHYSFIRVSAKYLFANTCKHSLNTEKLLQLTSAKKRSWMLREFQCSPINVLTNRATHNENLNMQLNLHMKAVKIARHWRILFLLQLRSATSR